MDINHRRLPHLKKSIIDTAGGESLPKYLI